MLASDSINTSPGQSILQNGIISNQNSISEDIVNDEILTPKEDALKSVESIQSYFENPGSVISECKDFENVGSVISDCKDIKETIVDIKFCNFSNVQCKFTWTILLMVKPEKCVVLYFNEFQILGSSIS